MKTALAALLLSFVGLAGCSGGLQPPKPRESPGEQARLAAQAERLYDEKALRRALQRVLAWHKRHNSAVFRALRPGLSDEEIDVKTRDLPFRLPEELRSLYRWRDGASGHPLVWYHNFPSLDEAVAIYRRNRNWRHWDESWMPVFEFESEAFFVACATSASRARPVSYHSLEEPEYWAAFASLTAMMLTAADGFEQGAVWVVDPEIGAMEQDIARVRELHRRHNPGVAFPYYFDEAGP